MAVVFKGRVTLAMPHPVGVLLPDGLRRGGPRHADVFIANVNGSSGRIRNGIVRPGREAFGLAVAAPDAVAARLGNQRAEIRIGHDVDPGQWRLVAGPEIDDEFLAVLGKTAQPVEVIQFHEGQRGGRFFAELPTGDQ